MTLDAGRRLFILRTRLSDAHVGPDPDAPACRALAAGEARLAVDKFALTANNITYAAFGEAMKYWQFFPSSDSSLGCLPVWGFATVIESQVEGLAIGRRIWGYYPAGTHLVVKPKKVSAAGFVDGAEYRQELALVYNQYIFCDADPSWKSELEGLQAVLRPLFITSFLIDDFLADNDFFGAEQLLLSSASSKTALGTAYCLSLRRGTPGTPKIVGLTSSGKAAFVRSLGCFDDVRLYDEVADLPARVPSVYVDFAGNAELRRTVHTHFAQALTFSSAIGGTHWQNLGYQGGGFDLPGPRPTLFFAPAQVKKRSAPLPEGWGGAELQRRLAAAWVDFIKQVSQHDWVQIVQRPGPEQALLTYREMLAGIADPAQGLMLSMRT